jgi:formate-nitrite transporter family protein
VGLSALAVAFLANTLSPSLQAVTLLGYPLGFLVVIIGRQRLFTENTLFPVALCSRLGAGDYLRWLSAAVAGNIVGGVVVVALTSYAQVRSGKQPARDDAPPSERRVA